MATYFEYDQLCLQNFMQSTFYYTYLYYNIYDHMFKILCVNYLVIQTPYGKRISYAYNRCLYYRCCSHLHAGFELSDLSSK